MLWNPQKKQASKEKSASVRTERKRTGHTEFPRTESFRTVYVFGLPKVLSCPFFGRDVQLKNVSAMNATAFGKGGQ